MDMRISPDASIRGIGKKRENGMMVKEDGMESERCAK